MQIFIYLCIMHFTVAQLAEIIGGKVEGDGDLKIYTGEKIEEAKPGSVTFLANPKYEPFIYTTNATAVVVDNDFIPKKDVEATLIKVENVYSSLVVLLDKFSLKEALPSGISEGTYIDKSASIGEGTDIGINGFIGSNVRIGKNCKLYPQVYIGNNSTIGDNCVLYPGVKIFRQTVIGNHCVIQANAVIGSDGYGYAPDNKGIFHKIPQAGNVVLGDHVEVGACTVIDRATMGNTVLHDHVKLDNLIQIAHNVEIEKNSMMAAQAGIAGSTKIGKGCMIGGQVGIVGHIQIADGTKIQAQSGVSHAIKKPNTALFGSPAIGYTDFIRSFVHFKEFPSIVKRINALEKELKQLKGTE
jgi:UDP-3-O-[3-hydroxymyristoyl] glucosamine N-acyltransferase